MNKDITINGNVCVPNGDTHTQSISTHSFDVAVFALNNCTGLTKLWIRDLKYCKNQELKVEKLSLKELIVDTSNSWGLVYDSNIPLISDIIKKSKDTLSYLSCDGKVDLSSLRNSTQLRTLMIIGFTIDDANLNVILTFTNLEELGTHDKRIVAQFNESQTLKKLWWSNIDGGIDDLPQSVTKVITYQLNTFDQVKQFLEKNPFVKELELYVSNHVAAQLLDKFKHIKFNFNIGQNFFTFQQLYTYLHPECMQICIPGSEPDHQLYELLFSRIHDKEMVLYPYLMAADQGFDYDKNIKDAPPEMFEQLQTFNEFKNCLRKDELDSSYFERVFNLQLSTGVDEYLLIIVSAYDEVFQLSADIDKTVTILMAMNWRKREFLKRERFFHHCRHNWMEPLTNEDFKEHEESD
ncbi:hypothetical protein FGO68_gene8412 [Halteria grandinella]|uniref:Uncharacterized protein n=1 Tax=Halteria grandinella TaxID=5974 RepID=A0A8J8NZ86_HALGN|nr:hypothetical protein FGO68_gene8412 [Halteria grandinella]